ncbi:chemotaxis protein CheB [Deferribacter thermophilus]|uniref:chemotaxis protein CheB n=1 Tax=Deferribacter thermophilus TaxID=53573 RepID=UPI003C2399B6
MSKINVLIADDSIFIREALKSMLEESGEIGEIFLAENGKQAIEICGEKRIDVVLMDLDMPELNGEVASRVIFENYKLPIIVITALDSAMIKHAFGLIQNFCIDVVNKPEAFSKEFQDILLRKIKNASTINYKSKRVLEELKSKTYEIILPDKNVSNNLFVFAMSTGGPKIKPLILKQIEAINAPFVLIQHIEPEMFEGYIEWIESKTSKEVISVDYEISFEQKDCIYILNPKYHTELYKRDSIYFKLQRISKIDLYTPPADPFVVSAAKIFKSNIRFFVFTGMCSDGLEGAKAVKENGGKVFCQKPEEALVSTMPQSVINAGYCYKVFSVADLSKVIVYES